VLTGSRFPVTGPSLSPRDIGPLLKAYESVVDVILRLMICGAYWSEPEQDTTLLQCFKRIADQQSFQTSIVALANLKRYPSLLLLYGAGIAALSRHNYRFLRSLLGLRVKYDAYKPEKTVASAIFDQTVLSHDHQQLVFGNRHTPLSDHLFDVLREPLRGHLPSDGEYSHAFDWFEYLLGLCHCDAGVSRSDLEQLKAKDPNYTLWASVGRFGWDEGEPDILLETELIADQPYPEKVAAVLNAGFFESGSGQYPDKYGEVKAGFDRLVMNVRGQWMF
jgi:hypothetical protein